MNRFASLRGKVARFGAAASVMALSASAFAQAVTDPFDAAMSTVTGKVNTYGAAMVGLAAVAVVFMVAIKYVKKIPKSS